MSRTETALTLVSGAAVLPPDIRTAGSWRSAAMDVCNAVEITPYRGLCALMFREVGADPREVCPAAESDSSLRFRDAGEHTQHDLARAAVARLIGQRPQGDIGKCRLALYATSSVDEDFYHSTISRLAAEFSFSHVSHFAVGGLQGASLPAAAELLDAMLLQQDEAALFVCAEKWPLPFPRPLGRKKLLEDGAAALWFVRGEATGLRYIGGQQSSCVRLFIAPTPRAALALDTDALVREAVAAIASALDSCGLSARDVDGWLPASLDPELDDEIRSRLGARAPQVVPSQTEDGYLGAAALPATLVAALERVQCGALTDGRCLVSWGASLSGGIGVALWQIVTPERKTQ